MWKFSMGPCVLLVGSEGIVGAARMGGAMARYSRLLDQNTYEKERTIWTLHHYEIYNEVYCGPVYLDIEESELRLTIIG